MTRMWTAPAGAHRAPESGRRPWTRSAVAVVVAVVVLAVAATLAVAFRPAAAAVPAAPVITFVTPTVQTVPAPLPPGLLAAFRATP